MLRPVTCTQSALVLYLIMREARLTLDLSRAAGCQEASGGLKLSLQWDCLLINGVTHLLHRHTVKHVHSHSTQGVKQEPNCSAPFSFNWG